MEPNEIRGLLFDLDGTLVDSFEAIRASVNHVRQRHRLDPLDLATVRSEVGNGVIHLMRKTVPVGEDEKNAELYLAHHPSVIYKFTTLLPGVQATLRKLHERGIRLGVCSNKPFKMTELVLKHLAVEDFFDIVLGPESVPKRKPAPDMLLVAIAALGLLNDEVVYIGDMTIDCETARAAQVRCWAISTGVQTREELLLAQPDRMLESFEDLLNATGLD